MKHDTMMGRLARRLTALALAAALAFGLAGCQDLTALLGGEQYCPGGLPDRSPGGRQQFYRELHRRGPGPQRPGDL